MYPPPRVLPYYTHNGQITLFLLEVVESCDTDGTHEEFTHSFMFPPLSLQVSPPYHESYTIPVVLFLLELLLFLIFLQFHHFWVKSVITCDTDGTFDERSGLGYPDIPGIFLFTTISMISCNSPR